ncbi:hypothetical protein WICMUC_000364 [Wickerhamomyces mucosus]|uniref:Major facilitator superfamily (MFS) profile domain-containing protein n=1 Tax=Wickerhamomyces mucosus TaxID=1378264 RepID=A0A9P8TI49_9ASCO|nr:hypothetical protein WICMUC_000364 [Wickerhamomyces mucosus]
MAQSVGQYLKTRVTTLFPSKEEINHEIENINPFPALAEMTGRQWQFFILGFLAWSFDAFDYFSVSVNVNYLAEDFGKTVKDITWAMTLVLMLRSVGSVIVGFAADKYGRKWPLIINMAVLAILEVGTGFVTTFEQFLGVRALFGIAMGGMFGVASATALESAPKKARSALSGIFQEGYAFGYLLVVALQRGYVKTEKGWRCLFWTCAPILVCLICWRLTLPETDAFLQQKLHLQNKKSSFKKDAAEAFRQNWLKMIYLVLLMSGFNFMSHGSQDLYPTFLSKQLQFSSNASTVTNVCANLGAIVGGILFAHFSGLIGRRSSIAICCICGGALIYPWAFVKGPAINAGAFFLQFFVQGAWGVVPIHLAELSPPEFKAFVSGVAYQLGNLASSASSTIETTIGERFPLPELGEDVYDYGKVMAIFVGCVFGYVLIIALIGPENRNGEINFKLDEKEIQELQEDGLISCPQDEEERIGSSEVEELDEAKNEIHYRENGNV